MIKSHYFPIPDKKEEKAILKSMSITMMKRVTLILAQTVILLIIQLPTRKAILYIKLIRKIVLIVLLKTNVHIQKIKSCFVMSGKDIKKSVKRLDILICGKNYIL